MAFPSEMAPLLLSALGNWLFFNRRPLDPAGARRVLIVQTRDIGDVALASVLIAPLRERFPNAELHMAVGPWGLELARRSLPIDGVLTYHSRLASNARGKAAGLRQKLASIRAIVALHPDVVVDIRGDIGTLAAAILSGASHRADRGSWRLRNALGRGRQSSRNLHEAEESLAIAEGVGIANRGRRLSLLARGDDQRAVDVLLGPLLETGRPLVALHPGASNPAKCWPAERFAAVASRFAARYSVSFVITGSTDEKAIAARVAETLGPNHVDLCGKLTLSQLYPLYRRCILWIGNDTGPMHIAIAANLPIVAVWGPAPAHKYHPFGVRSLVVERKGEPGDVKPGPDYMAGISVEDVWPRLIDFVEEMPDIFSSSATPADVARAS